MLPSGLHVNKPVIFGLFAAGITLILLYRHYGWSSAPENPRSASPADSKIKDDLVSSGLEDPPPLDEEAKKQIKQESKDFDVVVGEMKFKIHVEQFIKDGVSPKLDILLLHGAAFSSQDWVKLETTHHIANWGYRAVAIDLPGGKGKSTGPGDFKESQYAELLSAFISTLQMKKVVIVAPSRSGKYALPYLLNDPKTSTERAVGFVPIAPVDTQLYKSKYSESQVPTLIVYGTEDKIGKDALEDLQRFPKHETAPLKGAKHACYLEKPDDFHKLLFHFLNEVAK